jgi:hypothetical protein
MWTQPRRVKKETECGCSRVSSRKKREVRLEGKEARGSGVWSFLKIQVINMVSLTL